MHQRTLACLALTLLFLLTPLPASGEPAGAQATSSQDRPNVILIYTDDQGSVDANCYGSKDLITPHMDALAERGVRFTQMYAPSPLCTPSRVGLMTGRIPVRAGLQGNASSTKGEAGLSPEEITIAELLRSAGYATGHVGKWHLGYSPETMPNAQGFDYSFGHMGGCIDNYSHFFYWQGPNRHDLWRNGQEVWGPGRFFGDLMVEECLSFIRKNRNRPFFLYWAMNLPHYPLQGGPQWQERYKRLPSPRRMYAEFLSTADELLGRVIKELDDTGLRNKTLVIFQSDNGHSLEERTFGGGGNAGPYRGAKASMFEGGLRVPSIVSMPGSFPENEVGNQMVTGCDWFPTIAEICGVDLPQRRLDGKSIVSVIRSPQAPSPHHTFYWQLFNQWAVREGKWKLLGNPRDMTDKTSLTEDDKLFLVDLSQDIGEKENRAKRFPEVVARLLKIRQDYLSELKN
ncbi:MAG: sulfatase-like hydrolase/transferase [Acidobacteriota bacterium]